MNKEYYQVLIIGGGTAGLTVAAQLCNQEDSPEVAIIEPSTKHYYQPIWTLVGGGVFPKEISEREEAEFIPYEATWIRDYAAAVDPEEHTVTTREGRTIGYDFLVVAPGIQIDWEKIPGLTDALGQPGSGVCSNYSYDTVESTWAALRSLKEGNSALFTQPSTPVKCGGAPQKIMYLTGDYLRKKGMLDSVDIQFFSPGTVIFGIEEFARTLKKVVDRYGINLNFKHDLTEIRGDKKEAVFAVTKEDGVEERVVPYDMIHVVPPMSAPDFIKESLIANDDGWVDVDKHTLQHNRYPTVFSLGDAAGTPNAKTGAAVRKQAPVVVHNLLKQMNEGVLEDPKTYHGYSSCPLVTGYGKLVLAEFDYDNNPDPSFPFDTTQERYSMYALKAYGLPKMYWHGMLRGRA